MDLVNYILSLEPLQEWWPAHSVRCLVGLVENLLFFKLLVLSRILKLKHLSFVGFKPWLHSSTYFAFFFLAIGVYFWKKCGAFFEKWLLAVGSILSYNWFASGGFLYSMYYPFCLSSSTRFNIVVIFVSLRHSWLSIVWVRNIKHHATWSNKITILKKDGKLNSRHL